MFWPPCDSDRGPDIHTRGDGDDPFVGQDPCLIHQHRCGAGGRAPVAQLTEAVVTPSGERAIAAQCNAERGARIQGDDGLASEHAAHGQRHRHAAVGCTAVAELAVAVGAPAHPPDERPLQDQVIAGATEVVGHEGIGHPITGEIDSLALRQIGESALNRVAPGVVHHRQARARGRCEVHGECHRTAAGHQIPDRQRHVGGRIEGKPLGQAGHRHAVRQGGRAIGGGDIDV